MRDFERQRQAVADALAAQAAAKAEALSVKFVSTRIGSLENWKHGVKQIKQRP